MFDEHDRIIITNSRFQEAFRVVRSGRHDHINSREMCPQRFQALRVMCCDGTSCTTFCAYHHGHLGLTAEHITVLRALVAKLVHRQGRKIHIHDLRHRTHTHHGSPYRSACNGCLGNRSIQYTLFAKFIQQSARGPIGAAVQTHILTHDKYTLVTLHFFPQSFLDRLGICDLSHGRVSLNFITQLLFSCDIISVSFEGNKYIRFQFTHIRFR